MTETPEEYRRRAEEIDAKFYEQLNKRSGPHLARSSEYEKLAVEYSHRAFQLLTYLNGGALAAIPPALAFFKADVGKADVLITAGAFVTGLVLISLAQGFAYFTMARRAEASLFFSHEQYNRATALQHPLQSREFASLIAASSGDAATGSDRLTSSNKWRHASIAFFWLSLVAFVFGCGWGAWVVMVAKAAGAKS